jgi:hypothetical protein
MIRFRMVAGISVHWRNLFGLVTGHGIEYYSVCLQEELLYLVHRFVYSPVMAKGFQDVYSSSNDSNNVQIVLREGIDTLGTCFPEWDTLLAMTI